MSTTTIRDSERTTYKLLTAQEVADRLGVSRSTIYRWITQGRISPVHLMHRGEGIAKRWGLRPSVIPTLRTTSPASSRSAAAVQLLANDEQYDLYALAQGWPVSTAMRTRAPEYSNQDYAHMAAELADLQTITASWSATRWGAGPTSRTTCGLLPRIGSGTATPVIDAYDLRPVRVAA